LVLELSSDSSRGEVSKNEKSSGKNMCILIKAKCAGRVNISKSGEGEKKIKLFFLGGGGDKGFKLKQRPDFFQCKETRRVR
jgi:hypothetical protein